MNPKASPSPSSSEVAEGVRAFDRLYGDMDKVLWCLSRAARKDLLRGSNSEVVEALVWTIKSWWGVQGTKKETKVLMAQALAAQPWTQALFTARTELVVEAEEFACERVSALVSALEALGAGRREFSLASKVLHWLLPWQIPVYDSFVRKSVEVATSRADKDAYVEIVRWEYGVGRRLLAERSEWTGTIEPRSPFRALDKYLWWLSGGSSERAVVVRDPLSVVRRLGITPRQVEG